MRSLGRVRAFGWFGVLLVFLFVATAVDARGGRGGGGGGRGGYGGGGFSRGGGASGGSFRTSPSSRPSYSRPSQRPTTSRPTTQPARPSAGQQPARPSTGQQPARPSTGERPAAGTRPADSAGTRERPSQQPDRTGEREEGREDWQQHREDMQDDRQEYGKKAREDWQEYAEWDEGGGYWVGGWYGPVVYHDDVDDWVVFMSGIAIGTALTSTAYRSMQQDTHCTPTEVTVSQITYLKCGDQWYNRVMQGGSVSYVVVAAPPGF